MSLDISGSLNLFLPPSVTHVSRYFRITQSLFFLLLSRMSLDISGSLNLFLPPSVPHVSRYFRITQSLFFLLLSRMSLDISGSLNLFLPPSVTHVSRYFRITQSLSSSFCHACLSIFQDHSISFFLLLSRMSLDISGLLNLFLLPSVTHVSRYFRITQSLSSSFCHACL